MPRLQLKLEPFQHTGHRGLGGVMDGAGHGCDEPHTGQG